LVGNMDTETIEVNIMCDKFADVILSDYRESAAMGRHTGCRHCKCTWEYVPEEWHTKDCPVTDAKAWKELRK